MLNKSVVADAQMDYNGNAMLYAKHFSTNVNSKGRDSLDVYAGIGMGILLGIFLSWILRIPVPILFTILVCVSYVIAVCATAFTRLFQRVETSYLLEVNFQITKINHSPHSLTSFDNNECVVIFEKFHISPVMSRDELVGFNLEGTPTRQFKKKFRQLVANQFCEIPYGVSAVCFVIYTKNLSHENKLFLKEIQDENTNKAG